MIFSSSKSQNVQIFCVVFGFCVGAVKFRVFGRFSLTRRAKNDILILVNLVLWD